MSRFSSLDISISRNGSLDISKLLFTGYFYVKGWFARHLFKKLVSMLDISKQVCHELDISMSKAGLLLISMSKAGLLLISMSKVEPTDLYL
jgi:hypothetical protein